MNLFKFKQKKKENYFEGYYLRIIDEDNKLNLAFIFGITYNVKDPHAFVQFVDASKKRPLQYRYNIEDFRFDNQTIYLPQLILSDTRSYILNDDMKLDVAFHLQERLPRKFMSNSAMGIMHMFPMKTYQEIVFMKALVKGKFEYKGKEYKINGDAYMEKTYGYRFPNDWVWIQSNHFDHPISLSCSIGKTKVFGINMLGYVISLLYKGKEYRFATYDFGKAIVERRDPLIITATKGKYKLVIEATQSPPVKLKGPVDDGEMIMDVFESLKSTVKLTLTHREKTLIQSEGRLVGMENMHDV